MYAAILVGFVWFVAQVAKLFRRNLLSRQSGVDTVRKLSWREFESLVGEVYRRKGYRIDERGGSGDGGVDIVAVQGREKVLIQCKHWKTWRVGPSVVRQMYGVLIHESASRAVIVTTGTFTEAAREFAAEKPIQLIEGDELADIILEIRNHKPTRVPTRRVTPVKAHSPAMKPIESETVACKRCGAPMVIKTAKKGESAGRQFLVCTKFPHCKEMQDLTSTAAV